MLVVQAVLAARVGTAPVSVKAILPNDPLEWGGARIPGDRLWFAAVIVVLTVVLALVFRLTRFGLAARAAAESEKGALVSGLSPDRIAVANWALSSAIGEVALGTALVIGFAIHNLTEGVAIAAPLARSSPPQWWMLPLVACVAGLPAVPGLLLGGLTGGGVWAVLGLGIAAGAIAQVVLALGRLVAGKPGPLAAASFTAAVGLMYLTGLLA